MPDKLNALLERLKAHQRTLILAMAEYDGLPAGSALRQVAELENVIAAVEAVADEETAPDRQSKAYAPAVARFDPGLAWSRRVSVAWQGMQSDYDHGESLECLACGAVYAATAEKHYVLTEDDARCTSCTSVMTHWPQKVGFEMIETASEARR